MGNDIVSRFGEHEGFTPQLASQALGQIVLQTGFVVKKPAGDRRIYNPDQTWRFMWVGTYQGKPAALWIDNLKLPVPEETNSRMFRERSLRSRIRPPLIYANADFSDAAGYAWTILEDTSGYPCLFQPAADPESASLAFVDFYGEHHEALATIVPFWQKPEGLTARSLTEERIALWMGKSQKDYPDRYADIEPSILRLRERLFAEIAPYSLVFQHAHLTGDGIWLAPDYEIVVGQNFLWNWRVEGYDMAFPLWHQWMSLPVGQVSAKAVAHITDTWMERIWERDIVSPEAVHTLLGERLIGALLMDIPAKRHTTSAEHVRALERACKEEAERWLLG